MQGSKIRMAEEKQQADPPKAQVSSKRYRIRKRLLIRLTLLLIVIGIIYFIMKKFVFKSSTIFTKEHKAFQKSSSIFEKKI